MARPRLGLLGVTGALIAGCGGGDGDDAGRPQPPATTQAPITGSLPPGRELEREDGSVAVRLAGCLACHRLAGAGNDGPGPSLDGVGSRLSDEEIRAALVDPQAPMPSYESLPDLDLVVRYLSGLR